MTSSIEEHRAFAETDRRERVSAVRRVLAMEVVSGMGDGIFWVGLALLLVDRGDGAVGLALAALARFGPRAVLSAPAGVLADRVDRRVLLVVLDIARGVSMAALAVAASQDVPTVFLLCGVAVVYTLAAPYRPTVTAALPLVAGERRLASANAQIATVRQLMTFVGPVVGAGLLQVVSPANAFAINATTFAISAVLIGSIRRLRAKRDRRGRSLSSHRGSWLREMRDGWWEVSSTAGLAVLVMLVGAMYAARGAEVVLLVLLADERLGLGADGIGLLTGAIGLGAMCMLPVAPRVASTERPAVVMVVVMLSSILPFVVLGMTRRPIAACASLVVLGAGVVAFEVLSTVLLQRLVRRGVLGRVFGLVGTFANAGKLLGAVLAPALVSFVGLSAGMFLASGLLAAVAAFAIPGLTRLDQTTRRRRDELAPIVDALAVAGLFAGAPRTSLERLAQTVERREVLVGSVVVHEGDRAEDLFLVVSGSLSVSVAGRQINTMGPGDWFGEIGLLQRRPRTATVTTTAPTVLWQLPGEEFLLSIGESASEPTEMLQIVSERLARSETRR